MFAFFGFMLLAFFYLSYTKTLGSQWQINSMVLFLILAGMLVLSATEIPIYRIRTKKPDFSDDEKALLSEFYSVPVAEELEIDNELVFNSSITLNVGGFILPLILAAYVAVNETLKSPIFASLEILLIILVLTHLLTEFKSGVGIVIPDYIGLLAIPFALILEPENVASIVLVSGVFGILIGIVTSLFNINENTKGSAFINLGGVGNFKAIYITVLVASLLSYAPV
ncbi:MAG TPA: DUF1614 domain-containing protein [Candidatus Nanoarchaeia archaeon]|nr:DUF1614 domain-containing protein [Candidatus Nanoarchaeia archaeon]